tara:strand:+ start:432 stop:788 length:357 start_codon:yes stop_codon:yes gene_type:complete
MKSRLEIIIEKLPNQEVELSAHKVELALIDGLERDIDKIYEDLSRADGVLQKGALEAERISKNAELKAGSSMETVKKAEQMAKELGIDLPQIKELKQRVQNAEKRANVILKKATIAAK